MDKLTSWIATDGGSGSMDSPDTLLLRVLYVAAIICLAIVVYQTYRYRSVCDTAIEGFWAGDPAFVRDSQLRDFQWQIAPRVDGKDFRSGFIIVADRDGKLIAQNPLSITVKDLSAGWNGDVTCSVSVDVDGPASYDIPRDLVITCDIGGKQLEARDESGNVVFKGARDNIASQAFMEDWNDATVDGGDDAEKI